MALLKIGVVVKALRSIAAIICNFLYRIIATMYQLFMTISKLDILSSDQIAPIYQRVTMILTIVMTFYITFEFVKYTIQPDNMTDKEKGVGNILQRIVIVVAMIAFVPTIFRFAYSLQNAVIDNQVISKVLLGRDNTNYGSYGNQFSAVMLGLFYDADGCSGNNCSEAKSIVDRNLKNLKNKGTVDIASDINIPASKDSGILNALEPEILKEIEPAINFDGIFAIIVGAFIAYMLAMYCIDLGSRYVQIIFLQIISPIAIMGYLLPKKDGIFQKWLKQCITTYLDVFLRIAIIDFILLIVKVLGDDFSNGNIFRGMQVTPTLKALTYVALVMGLLAFARRAPKLLGDLFPSSGAAGIGFGLSPKGRGFDTAGRVVGTAAGTAIGAGAGLATGIKQGMRKANSLGDNATAAQRRRAQITGAIAGGARGVVGGAVRGGYDGSKKGNVIKNSLAGAKAQIKSNEQFGNRAENGYTFADQVSDRARSAFGLKSRIKEYEEQKAPLEAKYKANEDVFKEYKGIKDEAKKHAIEEGKGRYSAAYKAAEQRVHDLRERGAEGSGFKVGKYRDIHEADVAYQTAVANAEASVDRRSFFNNYAYEQAMDMAAARVDRTAYQVGYASNEAAYDAYVNAVKSARASVNKANYTDSSGNVNNEAYEREMARVAAEVNQNDFKVGYATQAEADNAYNIAVQNARAAVNADSYIDTAAYDAAKARAAASVNQQNFRSEVSAYATQAEAEAAYNEALAKADEARDKAEKQAIYDFLTNGDINGEFDQQIINLQQQLVNKVKEYNANMKDEYKLDEIKFDGHGGITVEQIQRDASGKPQYDANGQLLTTTVQMTSDQFNAYTKKLTEENYQVLSGQIGEINAQIQRIKNETEGSGFDSGGKK